MGPAEDATVTRPLEDIQDEVLDRLHAGEPVDRAALAAQHPEHAGALAGFFALLDELEAPPAPDEPVPARLGEFRIVRELGRGGMGVVYEAEQPSLKRRVALKVLPPALRADRARVERFRREAEAAARLRHPNVVPVFSTGEERGAPFFAMELVEGVSLAEVLRERRAGGSPRWPETGEASWRRAAATAEQVAGALAYAHSRGILHRDVKPGNVLVEADGTPRLTDFGLALDLEAQSLTVSGEVFGSPRYMSPEQAFRRAAPLDARTDVYSLAVTLYELLTLELPYRGATQNDVLAALSSGDVVPLREVDGSLPASLEAVLARGLAHDPDERYPDAASFAADLRGVLEGRRFLPRPTPSGASGASAAKPSGSWASRAAAGLTQRRGLAFWFRSLLYGTLAVSLVAGLFHYLTARSRQAAAVTEAERALGARSVASAAELRGMARGAEGGEAVLRAWAQPAVRLRSIVARDTRAVARLGVTVALPDAGLAEPIALVPIWEYRLDDGPWRPTGLDVQPFEAVGTGTLSFWTTHDVSAALGALKEEREARVDRALGVRNEERTVRIAHRLRLRATTPPPGWVGRRSIARGEAERPHGTDPRPGVNGALAVWVWDERTLFLYDSFPADYPRAVRDPGLDASMRRAWTPRRATRAGLRDRSVELGLFFGADQVERPLPAAFRVELLAEPEGPALASGTLAEPARPPSAPGETTTTVTVISLDLGPEATEAEQRFLLALESGSLERLHLRLRASRDVALAEPDFDAFWGGDLDLEVPLGN